MCPFLSGALPIHLKENEYFLKSQEKHCIKSKPVSDYFKKLIKKYEKILVIDEQTPAGNLTSSIYESISFMKKMLITAKIDKKLPKNRLSKIFLFTLFIV